ncbi:MAG: hypothetical protein M0Q44_03600 [Methylobacter sp.]|jgi:hypothetical protein|nr:hypothetical protein [Methylobacter sp.]
MKSKRKILSLAISALLTAGVASYPMLGYADDNPSRTTDSSKSSDSDNRGSSDKSSQKITICHVPPGNPANKHTIHIAFSAWATHKAHTNNIGPDYADYLGSCNSKTTTTTKETLHVISGCTGTYHDTLAAKVRSYYEPITVADTSLDDESVVTPMSQCLDKGDSSDSGKNHGDSSKSISGGKGRGHDSVSDSGNHHRIRGCQNKDTQVSADSSNHHGVTDSDNNDANKNYHQKLKDADSARDNNAATGIIKDPIVVSDSSLDDSGVWTAYKTCVAVTGNANKIDSSKAGVKKGDSGHRQHVLEKSCVDASGDTLRNAIVAYKAKSSTKDIILTETSYNDVSIKQAVNDCVDASKGKGKDTVTSFSSNETNTVTGVTITGATVTGATVSADGVVSNGTVTAGTSNGGTTVIGGAITTGTSSGGTITGGTTTGGITTGATITGATITNATVSVSNGPSGSNGSSGVSGRLNFRENTSPVKN